MPKNAVWVSIDGERAAQALEEALQDLDKAEGEVVLDLSSVRRIDVSALRTMGKLAAMADEKGVKVTLRGVDIDIYRVLKLMNLAPRFFIAA